MDSSDTVGTEDYEKQKTFVKLVAQGLGISPTQSRGALMLYSDLASIQGRFDQYTNTKDFWKAVDRLRFLGGKTRLDRALGVASSDIFPDSRPGVEKIAIVLSDGYQTQASGAKGLKEASEPLRKDGVRIIAVGFSNDLAIKSLRLLVESDDDLMQITEDPEDPLMKASSLVKRICGKSSYETLK